jgi:hypothetical protein
MFAGKMDHHVGGGDDLCCEYLRKKYLRGEGSLIASLKGGLNFGNDYMK